LGRLDLTYNIYVRIDKYWLKIVCTNELKYCKLVYEVLNTDANSNPNKVSWVTLLKNLLSALGFYEVWLAQSVGNVDVSIHVFKQRLLDVNIQNWNSRIENEYHCIIECSLYTDLQRKYIPRYYWCNPNMYKLQELFCNKNRNIILRLSIHL